MTQEYIERIALDTIMEQQAETKQIHHKTLI